MTDLITEEMMQKLLYLVPIVAFIIEELKQIPAVKKWGSWLRVLSMAVSFGLLWAVERPADLTAIVLPAVILSIAASGGYDLLKGKK